jgi:hypothetical protein
MGRDEPGRDVPGQDAPDPVRGQPGAFGYFIRRHPGAIPMAH